MGMGLGDNESLNFKLGAEQVDRLYLGSAYVWPNVPIADVVATDNLVGLVTITWSDTNSLHPNTFDVYADDVKIATNVTSPHDYTIDESTKMYSVRGLYGGGHFIGSNEDSGTSLSGIAPGPITNFVASDNLYYEVQCTWSTVSGDPVPTYDLYENGGIVAQNVASGHVQASAVGTRPWHVVAVNAEGETPSNTDNGTSLDRPVPTPPGEMLWTVPGTYEWEVPYDITVVQICMIGGGGSGATDDNHDYLGGGFAGFIQGYGPTAVPAGGTVTVVVGAGGAPVGDGGSMLAGNIGGQSSFHDLLSPGGAGGSVTDPAGAYLGHGGSRETCRGTFTDGMTFFGNSNDKAHGGQAGFGNGGNGTSGDASHGGTGAGGGAQLASASSLKSGAGGHGLVYISWG